MLLGSRREAQTDYVSSQFRDSFDFPFNPDPLAQGNQYDIYDEMRFDDGVRAAMSVKKDAMVNTGWEIVCEEDEVKQFIEDQLNNLHADGAGLESSFEDCLRDMLSSLEYGFSLTEPVYRFDERIQYWTYRSLKTRPPHGIEFHIDVKGNVEKIIQNGSKGPLEIDPARMLHFVNNPQFGNPFGESDYRSAHPAWKAKKFVNRFMAIHLERFASGTAVLRHDGDTGEASEALEHIKRLQVTSSFALPKDMELELLEPKTPGAEHYIKALEHYNTRIARALLVPDLMGFSGQQTKGGSLALGKEQFNMFLKLIQTTRNALARAITLKLIRPLVMVNFGDIPCDFKFKNFTEELILDNFRVWNEAVGSGAILPTPEDVQHLKSQLGFPDSEPLVGPGKTAPTPEPGFEAQALETPESEAFVQRGGSKLNRAKTPAEKKVDFDKVNKVMNDSERNLAKRLQTPASKMINGFLDDVRSSGLLKRRNAERLNKVEMRFQKEMNRTLRDHFLELFDDSADMARREILPNGEKRFQDGKALVPEAFENVLRAESFALVGDYVTNVTRKGRSAILQAIKDGLGAGETFDIAKKAMRTESDRWINTVTRTKTTEIFNQARKSFIENDPITKQLVIGYQWSSIIDDRTSEICRCLDGKSFKIGPISDKLHPPAHFNCRSVLVPVTQFEDVTFIRAFPKQCFGTSSGLILQSQKTDERQFQDLSLAPLLVNSGDAQVFGDSTIVSPPGPGRRIVIRTLRAQNLNLDLPVQVGFRADLEAELKFQKFLRGNGDDLERKFQGNDLTLPEGAPLWINLSAQVQVHWEVEYLIVDAAGKRVA